MDAAKMEKITMALDSCLSQRLNASFTDAEQGGGAMRRQSIASNEIVNLSNFARFLTGALCLEVLLFWKEVEQYKTLFTAKERNAVGGKIWEIYVADDSPKKVNLKEDMVKAIAEMMKSGNLPEDAFDVSQEEIYSLMKMDLFPRYYEEMEAQAGKGEEQEVVATSMRQVLDGTTPPASRHFVRFAKENYLEEGLLFWLDANDFLLLFAKNDMHIKAKEIYDTYMSETAKFRVNTSDHIIAGIKGIVNTPVEEVIFDNQLFVPAQKEIETFLELDVWDRYVEWAKGPGKPGSKELERTSTSQELYDESKLDDRDKMRDACRQLLLDPNELPELKVIAAGLDCGEAIEFYLEVIGYQKLFAAADFKDNAKRIWKRYLDDKAERMVNLPATMIKKLKKEILDDDAAGAKTFDKANKEMLNLITDNVYRPWVTKKKAELEGAAGASAAPATPAPAKAPASSGGCCVVS